MSALPRAAWYALLGDGKSPPGGVNRSWDDMGLGEGGRDRIFRGLGEDESDIDLLPLDLGNFSGVDVRELSW